jgi:hypothetical protein
MLVCPSKLEGSVRACSVTTHVAVATAIVVAQLSKAVPTVFDVRGW